MAIGQKLEEARNRKGISIREASESTKIRGDYLNSFEAGDFDLKLPEVYLRGFIRVYARFLGIDPESAVSDLNLELGIKPGKVARKNFGSIQGKELSDVTKSEIPSAQTTRVSKTQFISPKTIIFLSVGSAIFLLLLFIILYSLGSGENDLPDDQSLRIAHSVRETVPEVKKPNLQPNNLLPPGADEHILKLAAIGPIDRLIISDEGKSPKVFHEFKNLAIGWETNIPFTQSFRCYSSSLESVRFAVDDGAEKQVSGEGAGNFRWNP